MDFGTALASQGKGALRNVIRTSKPFSATGGLNVMDAPALIPPGELLGCQNYEPGMLGGYRRFDGYERFDGHTSPSDAPYVSVAFSNHAFAPAPGATVTESGSGATGTLAYLDPVNYVLVLVNVSGTFVGNGSTLTSGTTTPSVGLPITNGGLTTALSDSYYYQKWLYFQSSIATVGGASCSGGVLAVWPHASGVYAWRNNSGGTQALMFKATTSGWVQIALGIKVRYKAGVYAASMQQMPEGTVLVGATSGATMTVKRVATLTGTWGTDAAGYFIVSAITGTPTANELLKVAGVTYCTYVSNAAQTIPPGGSYYLRSHNFNFDQNPLSGFRIYGTNGVGNGFEYDPVNDVYVAIETGMTTDTPTHLNIHANYLFYGFPGGSLQNSGYQLPLNWNPVFGADARSVGADITFMREDVSESMIIGTRRQLWILVGQQVEQFQIRVYSENTGAYEKTDEMPGQIVFAEDRGITTVAASAQYGNFSAASLTNKILDIVTAAFANDTPVGAILTRKKNLYRLIFASGNVLCLAINATGQFAGWTQGTYVHQPTCTFAGFWEDANGKEVERAFLGGANGYVYELDKGRSFDGQVLDHFLKFAYWNLGIPSTFSRYRWVQIDVRPEGSSSVSVGADCDYGNRTGQTMPTDSLGGGGGLWDVAKWDQFIWDAPAYAGLAVKLELEGYNISVAMSGSSVNDTPFTITSMMYQYSPRIINRNTKEA
jgi:hypothetical protein